MAGLLIGIVMLNLSLLIMMLGTLFGASFGAPFVPSGRGTTKKMIEIAEIKQGQRVFDLGCGDGRLVFSAAERGAYAVGIEISPVVFLLAKIRGWFSKKGMGEIHWGNFFAPRFRAEIEQALMERIFTEIFPKMKKGSRIISHAFSPRNVLPERVFESTRNSGKILVFKK